MSYRNILIRWPIPILGTISCLCKNTKTAHSYKSHHPVDLGSLGAAFFNHRRLAVFAAFVGIFVGVI